MTIIAAYKLSSGEEIIGRIVQENVTLSESVIRLQNTIKLEKVRTLAVQPTGGGQMGIGMMPFAYAQHDGEITIFRSAIIAEFAPDPQLEKVYLQQTTAIQLV